MPTLKAYDFFHLRSPSFPINDVEIIPQNLEEHFSKLLESNFFQNAIFIASVDLYNQAIKWKSNHLDDKNEIERLLLSLLRYWIRMCTRSTPFGLFAGCTVGLLANETNVTFEKNTSHKVACRLDMTCLYEISQKIISDINIRRQLKYFVNSSLYESGDFYRYIEYNLVSGKREYFISEFNSSNLLKEIFQASHSGCHFQELIKLVKIESISEGEAINFLDDLINNQILVSEIEPLITGDSYLNTLISKLETVKGSNSFVAILKEIQSILNSSLDGIHKIEGIRSLVKKISPDILVKDFVQFDLVLATDSIKINKQLIKHITSDVEELLPIVPIKSNRRIETFKEKFKMRYDNQEIPLLLAIDNDSGIGYDEYTNLNSGDTELIKEIEFYEKPKYQDSQIFDQLAEYKSLKLSECLRKGLKEIEINDDDIKKFGNREVLNKLPNSLYIHGVILDCKNEVLNKNENRIFLLKNFHGPTAANLLGRFCSVDESLLTEVKSILGREEEKSPESIFAEIVHLPQSRIGNVITRPKLREFEIPYLSNSSVTKEYQVMPDDLVISIRNDEILLRSKRLNKRIIPRLSTAHNFTSSNLPLYKLLCDLQSQSGSMMGIWDWGIFQNYPFLPRVCFRSMIIKRAQWLLTLEQNDLHNADSSQLLDHIERFKMEYQVPDRVQVFEDDNELMIDLSNSNCLKILIGILKRKRRIQFIEFISAEDSLLARNIEGKSFSHEVIFPIEKLITTNHTNNLIDTRPNTNTQRLFSVGSSWLYLKIYCGWQSIDLILKDVFNDSIDYLKKTGAIDKWFFIRYSDPEPHLRIRFHGRDDSWIEILKIVNLKLKTFLDKMVVHKIQVDTYSREIERYGIADLGLTESFFHLDSTSTLTYLLHFESDSKNRWLYAMKNIDMLLDDFSVGLKQKLELIGNLRKSLSKEFVNEKNLKRSLDESYRSKSKMIFDYLLDDSESTTSPLKKRSVDARHLVSEINSQLVKNCKSSEQLALLGNYIHMSLNRLFISHHRMYELMIYHFLFKYYTSLNSKKAQQELILN